MPKIIAQPFANIRSVPVISRDTDIGDLKPGQPVEIVEVNGDWSRVKVALTHGHMLGWVKSEFIVDDAPPLPPTVNHRAGNFVGMHDFPDASFWTDPNKRGWVVETVAFSENVNMMAFAEHRAKGGKVCLRMNWGYGQTLPINEFDTARFANWVDATVLFAGSQIDAIQIGNEPDIEMPPGTTAERIARIHTWAAERIRERGPHILISPCPLGFLMPINGDDPALFLDALWRAIKPEHRTLAVLHAYSHGANGNPNQTFTDWPLVGHYYNERSIEDQLAVLNKIDASLPILVGETNAAAPEHQGEPDAWSQQGEGEKVYNMIRYFAGVNSRVVGAVPFRWKDDKINGRSYGIRNHAYAIHWLRAAQSANL